MSDRYVNTFVLSIQRRLLPLKKKLINFCVLVSFTLFHLLIGFPTLFLSSRNNGQSECVSIIKISILLVQKTIILLPLSTKLLTNVSAMKYFCSWMDSLVTIKSIFTQRTNIRQHSSILGEHSLIVNSHLV